MYCCGSQKTITNTLDSAQQFNYNINLSADAGERLVCVCVCQSLYLWMSLSLSLSLCLCLSVCVCVRGCSLFSCLTSACLKVSRPVALTENFNLLDWKLAHWLLLPWKMFTTILASCVFLFRVKSPYGTDGLINWIQFITIPEMHHNNVS